MVREMKKKEIEAKIKYLEVIFGLHESAIKDIRKAYSRYYTEIDELVKSTDKFLEEIEAE